MPWQARHVLLQTRQKHVQLEGGRRTAKADMYPQRLSDELAMELVGAGDTGYVVDVFSGGGIIGSSCVSLGPTS